LGNPSLLGGELTAISAQMTHGLIHARDRR
jgi:hypothetical protein